MNILFISTHNLATNPRLVKEIDLALLNNDTATVVCCEFDNWSAGLNGQIRSRLGQHAAIHLVSATRRPFLPWLLSSFLFTVAGIVLKITPGNIFWLSVRSNKRSWLLMRRLKKIRGSFDLVVAHNPGSFYPALSFAKRQHIPVGIDLEDYHPGETNDTVTAGLLRRLNNAVLPKVQYLSAASPMILDYSLADLGKTISNTSVILNYFPAKEFVVPASTGTGAFKFVWFSQNIAAGRGLEEIIPVIQGMENTELHLYGHLDESFAGAWLQHISNIIVHKPLPQVELHAALHQYDAALALEKPASNLNRDLCITNKILAFFQAGLYIIASDTSAQQQFIDAHPGHGCLTEMGKTALTTTIEKAVAQRHTIHQAAPDRFNNAAGHNWETESKKLSALWLTTS